MPRQTVSDKASRLLSDGAVHVHRADEKRVSARVRGDSGNHDVNWQHGTWTCTCTCAAYGPRCSHIAAVRQVTMSTGRGL